MKIKKYALGAVFTPYEWVLGTGSEDTTQGQTPKASNKEATKDKGIDFAKYVLDITNKSGLYSDRTMLAAQAGQFIDLLSSDAPDSVKQKMLMQLQLMANDVVNNYSLWKEAASKVSKEDLGSDLAMDSRGDIYVIDNSNNKITAKSLNTIKENPETYHMLTWNELLDSRNDYSVMAFDMESIQSVSSAVGMQEIMKQVVEIIGKIGKETTEGYTSKIGSTVQKGLEYLFAPMSTEEGTYLTSYDGLYELKQTDSNAAKNINAAVNYIFTHLTESAKNAVRANAYNMGFDSPSQLIELAIVENISSSRELKYVKPEDDTKGSKKGSGSGGTEQTTIDSWGHSVFSDKGLPSIYNITLGGNVRMTLPARRIDNVLTKDYDQLDVSRLSQSYHNFQEWGLVDSEGSVYFGDIPLTSPLLEGENIIVDNSGGLYVVNMPIYENGEINWELYNIMNEIQESIVDERITDENEIAKIWADNGFMYNPETKMGQPVNMKSKQFIVQKAFSSSKNDELRSQFKESSVLEEAPKGVIETYQKHYNLNPIIDEDKIDLEAGMFGKNYQGLIFIPMTANQNNVLTSSKIGYIPKPNTNEIKAYQDASIHGGGYDYGSRQFNGLNGTTVNDL